MAIGRALAIGRVEAAPVRHRLEAVGQADHRLGRAEHEIAVALGDARDAVEHADLGLLVEIDQHVAAEHHVERAEMREIAAAG